MKIIYILASVAKCWVLCGIALLLSEVALAQDQKMNAPSEKDSVVVVKYQQGVLFNNPNELSTASSSSVSGETLGKSFVSNLTQTLYGQLPGLVVQQGTEEPGGGNAWLMMRGVGSYQSANMTVFVDGFETNMSYVRNLSPFEIESVSVLKDAAALAPLGMRGANGALWIVTKRGKPGAPQIRLQTRYGMQMPVSPVLKPLESYDYASLYNEAYFNDNGRVWDVNKQPYSNNQLLGYQEGAGTNVDWYAETIKEKALYYNIDFTFSGGSDDARYFILLGYNRPEGLYNVTTDDTHANSSLSTYNIRVNTDFKMFSIFEARVDIGGRIDERVNPNNGGNYAFWDNLARYPSNIYPVKNYDGTWTGTAIYPNNPAAHLTDRGYVSNHNRRLQANFTVKEKLDMMLKGFYLSQSASFNTWTSGTYSKTRDYARFIDGVQTLTNENTPYSISDDNGSGELTWTTWSMSAGYDKQFGDHGVSAALDYRTYSYNTDADSDPNYGFKNLGGRVNYNFDHRYVAELGFAYSGSDNFRKENQWGFYPTVSAAWIASNENFLKDSKSISFLKLRTSVGMQGNNEGPRYPFAAYFNRSAGGINTGNDATTWRQGLSYNLIANPDAFAEKSLKYDAGIELRLFNSVDVTFDAFLDKRSDILTVDYNVPAILGADLAVNNIGKVTNKGFDLSVNYMKQIGSVELSLGGMAGYFINKVDYMGEVPPVEKYMAETGNPIWAFTGLEATGFYDVSDFDASGKLNQNIPWPAFGAVQPGDIRYADLNSDKVIDENDVKIFDHTAYPKFNYAASIGLKYKGIYLECLLQGMSCREVNILRADDGYNYNIVAFANNSNAPKMAMQRWAYYPEQGIDTRSTATYPRLSLSSNTNNYRNSSFWFKNGDYIRLRNVELGYSFPQIISRKIGMKETRIFVSGNNLLTFSDLLRNYKIDPETTYGYPAVKSSILGLSLNF